MDNDSGVAVAKKRAKVTASSDRKPMIAQLRGAEAWKAWIERAAAFDTRTVAGFLERAAVRYAREIGFTEEPPER
jgi:uncharacterized protein (DUF1778 family)